MNLALDTQRVVENPNIKESDKKAILQIFATSAKVEFGKIGPRQEGYIYLAGGYPRCTAVLQMDGMRASALLEWAKREIVEDAKFRLKYELHKSGELCDDVIDFLLEESFQRPDREKNDAADEGTKHHDNIERWLNKEEGVEESEQLNTFKQIWAKEGVELICTEMPLIYIDPATDHGFGGKLDILAYKNGEFIIYDNKTSRSIHNSYGLQVAAYKQAVEQMSYHQIQIKTAKIIHLPNMSQLKEWQKKMFKKYGNLVECKNLLEAFTHFRFLLEQYYRRNNKYF